MGLYRDEALVLRVQTLGEADRIVTLLTRRSGRVRAVAKGVRRTRSKFGARVEPFGRVDVALYEPRRASGLHIVTEVVVLEAFGAPLAADYPRYTAASGICEAAERLTAEEGVAALRLHLLTLGALRALVEGAHPPGLVLDAFLLRALGLSGYGLALDSCAGCGAGGPHLFFAVAAGGAVCAACRPGAAARPGAAVLALLRALEQGDWVLADASAASERRAASGLVSASWNWHLERSLRSLALVERG